MAVMTIDEAQDSVLRRLRDLDATGQGGFEGLVASALTDLSGVDFRVVKSGHQHGTDVRSVPHNLFRVGSEVKRYGEDTALSRDRLIAKITEASIAPPPLDLWVLAVSRYVDASDREALHLHGASLGIGVLVLDCPKKLTSLCDLVVLCATRSPACESILNPEGKLAGELGVIRAAAGFEDRQTRLKRQLLDGGVGYASARAASGRWMAEAQDSLSKAKRRLGGHHNLGEPELGVVVRRRAVDGALQAWYAGDHPVAALVGDEGSGKSWAVLDWERRLRSSVNNAPLTVFIRARDIDAVDASASIADALAKQTGARDGDFWRRRLGLWERSGRTDICLLVLVDGLNENFEFKGWSDWLQPLLEDDLAGMYRVAVGCWSNWWRHRLFQLPDLLPRAHEIPVTGFDDEEMSDVFASMGVEAAELPSALVDVMRVPRLCALAFRHRKRMKVSGDLTAERLVYEDWKDRLERRGVLTGLSDEEMRDFIAEFGKNLRENVKQDVRRRDVLEKLSEPSGKSSTELEPAITELSSGGWLKPVAANRYTVVEHRIPFVLGAALVKALSMAPSPGEVEAGMAEFLDPLKQSSLAAATLRSAVTIALLDVPETRTVSRALLVAWLELPNFSNDDFAAFWRIVGLRPDLVLDVAEERWLDRRGGTLEDVVLVRGLSNASVFPTFADKLVTRLERWLGTAWLDPRVGAFLEKVNRGSPDSMARVAETTAAFEAWNDAEASATFPPIRLKDHDGWSWLGWRALAIMSRLDPGRLRGAVEAWALSRAAMGWARHEEEMAWVLRRHDGDRSAPATALRASISRLEESGHAVARRAAGYLRDAMPHVTRSSATMSIDPEGQRGAVRELQWDDDDADARIESARAYLEPHGWLRLDPKRGARLVNSLLETHIETRVRLLDLLTDHIGDVLGILTPAACRRLREWIALDTEADGGGAESDPRRQARLRLAGFMIDAYRALPAVQSRLVLEADFDALPDVWLPLCDEAALEDVAGLEPEGAPNGQLSRWLEYLYQRLDDQALAGLDFVAGLVTHEDEEVRLLALALAVRGKRNDALRAFASAPPMPEAGRDRRSRRVEYWPNVARLEFCDYSPSSGMWEDLSPECIALIADRKPSSTEAREAFGAYLKGEFEKITGGGPWRSDEYWSSHEDAVAALVQDDLDGLLAWLVPWMDACSAMPEAAWMSDFPVLDTMRALRLKAPDVSLDLWETVIGSPSHGIAPRGKFEFFPFEMPRSVRSDRLCDGILWEANTDRALMEVACAALRNARLDWLLERICELEGSERPWDVACAYTLLGVCDERSEAEEFWTAFRERPPAHPWLRQVLADSILDYQGNRTVRTALSDFWSIPDPSEARHLLKVVEEKCDMRTVLWLDDLRPEWEDQPRDRRMAFGLAVSGLNRAVKRDGERRKKLLFHRRIGTRTMVPWA